MLFVVGFAARRSPIVSQLFVDFALFDGFAVCCFPVLVSLSLVDLAVLFWPCCYMLISACFVLCSKFVALCRYRNSSLVPRVAFLCQ